MDTLIAKIYKMLRTPFRYDDKIAYPCARECFRFAKLWVGCGLTVDDYNNSKMNESRISLVRFYSYYPSVWYSYKEW